MPEIIIVSDAVEESRSEQGEARPSRRDRSEKESDSGGV